MRYRLPIDRLVNMLMPHYMSGRRYILYLQSILYPLQVLNVRFVEFAKEKQIEARMTSQVMYFEWFLNYKLSKYFQNAEDGIFIVESQKIGVALYHEDAVYAKPFTVWRDNEQVTASKDDEKPKEFYYLSEEKERNKVSFMVCVPMITISEQEFVYMLSFIVNTYKIAGKTYFIKINKKEIEPNKKRF